MTRIAILLAVVLQAAAQRLPGSQLDRLPANMEVLTYFGERADISPDNQRVAFMAKSFGDAMVVDLATHAIRCLTCNVPAAAFLRVMSSPVLPPSASAMLARRSVIRLGYAGAERRPPVLQCLHAGIAGQDLVSDGA